MSNAAPQKIHQGFTLIELLVVISIIAILSVIGITVFSGVQKSARDAKRRGDLDAIRVALEIYATTNSNVYPLCNGNEVCSTTGYSGDMATLPIDMVSIPKDPTNISTQYGYYYARGYKPTGLNSFVQIVAPATDANQHYIIATRLENSSDRVFGGWDNPGLNYLRGQ